MLKTFIGTYIPDFNSIPSPVLEKKFLENRPIRIFKVTWWPCFLRNLHKSINSCVGPHSKHLCQVWFWINQRRSKFALKPYGKQHFHLLENSRTKFNQTWQRGFFWDPKKLSWFVLTWPTHYFALDNLQCPLPHSKHLCQVWFWII
jgi:hypothetical protein